MLKNQTKYLIKKLQGYVSPHKKELIEEILQKRTQYLTVVLEDIYQPHNASAVVRNCDCFGIQDLHIIEKKNSYKPHKEIVQGSAKWVSLHKHNQTVNTLNQLKNEGYKIVALTLRENSISLDSLPLDNKLALCFGTEETGLSETAHKQADYFAKIPMQGFTQSLNISVSVAITLYTLTKKLRLTNYNWTIPETAKDQLRVNWYSQCIQRGKQILERHKSDYNNQIEE